VAPNRPWRTVDIAAGIVQRDAARGTRVKSRDPAWRQRQNTSAASSIARATGWRPPLAPSGQLPAAPWENPNAQSAHRSGRCPAARRRSQQLEISMPAPMQLPSMRATMGTSASQAWPANRPHLRHGSAAQLRLAQAEHGHRNVARQNVGLQNAQRTLASAHGGKHRLQLRPHALVDTLALSLPVGQVSGQTPGVPKASCPSEYLTRHVAPQSSLAPAALTTAAQRSTSATRQKSPNRAGQLAEHRHRRSAHAVFDILVAAHPGGAPLPPRAAGTSAGCALGCPQDRTRWSRCSRAGQVRPRRAHRGTPGCAWCPDTISALMRPP